MGGPEKQVSLFPVFRDDSGRLVRGSFASNRLPGYRLPTEEERRGFYVSGPQGRDSSDGPHAVHPVQPAAYQSDIAAGAAGSAKPPGLKTTTIRVPRSMSERLAQAPPSTIQSQQAPLLGRTNTYEAWRETVPGAAGTPSGPLHATQPAMGPGFAPQPRDVPQGGTIYPPVNQQPHLGEYGFTGADPQNSVSATSRAWARQDPRSARFEQPRFRVPVAPGAPANRA